MLFFDMKLWGRPSCYCTDCTFNSAFGSTQEGKQERCEVLWNINYGLQNNSVSSTKLNVRL